MKHVAKIALLTLIVLFLLSPQFHHLTLPFNDCFYQRDGNNDGLSSSLLSIFCNLTIDADESALVLNDDLCTNVSLLSITIARKNIPKLSQFSFNSVSSCKIQALYLSSNQIQEIEPNTFRGLAFLRDLHLDDNRLEKVTADMFGVGGELPALENLWLQLNRITFVDVDAFTRMPALKKLILHLNQIDFIYKDTFKSLTQLTYLSLRSNKIVNIEPGTFDSLEKLSILYLYGNKIKTITSGRTLNLEFKSSKIII